MYKKMFVVVMICVFLIGCNSSNSNTDDKGEIRITPTIEPSSKVSINTASEKEETKEEINRLDEFKQGLVDEGFSVGDNETVAYEMMGASNGYKFKVNDSLIEIYEYTDDNDQHEQAKNGSVDMSGFNIPVIYSNGLALCRVNEHPNKDKIIDILNSID